MELSFTKRKRSRPKALTEAQLQEGIRYETIRCNYFQRLGYDVTELRCLIDAYFSRIQELQQEIPQLRDAEEPKTESAGTPAVEGWL